MRARVLRQAPLRAAPQRREPALPLAAWEIARWLRDARRSLDRADWRAASLGEYLDRNRYSARFRRHFLVPLTSALWSTAPGRALEFPADYAIRFFDNHGMLGFGRFRWRTVTGGSVRYVDAITARIDGGLHVGRGVRSVRRHPDGVELRTEDGEVHAFDQVVLATHADQALGLLEDATAGRAARARRRSRTRGTTRCCTPTRRCCPAARARASWNYRLRDDGRPTVTYHLNRLQGLSAERDYCLTLNEDVAAEHVLGRFVYEHPLYTVVDAARAGRPAAPARGADALRGRLLRQRLPRGRPRQRRRRARALGVEW